MHHQDGRRVKRMRREADVHDVDADSAPDDGTDEEYEEAVPKRNGRRRELAALLADQGKHVSVEQIQTLQKFVADVLDHNIVSEKGKRRERNAVLGNFSALPNMFGIVEGVSTGLGPVSSLGSSDKANGVDAVYDGKHHASRWREVHLGALGRLWVKNDKPIAPVGADSDSEADDTVELTQLQSSRRRAMLLRRRMEETRMVRETRQTMQDAVNLNCTAMDGIAMRDEKEFELAARRLPPGLRKVFSFDDATKILWYYSLTRNALVTHDRFLASLQTDRSTEVTLEQVTLLIAALHASIISLRKSELRAAATQLRELSKSGSIAALGREELAALDAIEKLSAVHPSLRHVETDATDGLPSASRLTALEESLGAESNRRQKLRTAIERHSSANIPLSRQEAKLATLRQAFASLDSRLQSCDAELRVEFIRAQANDIHEASSRIEETLSMSQESVRVGDTLLRSLELTLLTLTKEGGHPIVLREVEEALEKYLYHHRYALVSDSGLVRSLLASVRDLLVENISLKRALARKVNVIGTAKKIEADARSAVEANSEDGIPLPKV